MDSIDKIIPYLDKDEYRPFQMMFDAIRLTKDEERANKLNLLLRVKTLEAARRTKDMRFVDLNKLTYLYDAHDNFEDYLIYVEWNRPAEKKFYLPRRKVLNKLVRDLQDLADRKIDFLGISLPPRVGKSTLCIFFMTWLMGRNPETANVMSGHSDKLTKGFYKEVLSIISDKETYLWGNVFPDSKIVSQSAEDESIDLDKIKHYPTFTARSIGGTLTGAVEIGEGGCLYVDDLIADLEESLNPKRLDDKYNAYLNQLKDRKKDNAFELMVGTRWNVLDPLGRIREQYADNPRYRFTVIPALDENDESNFNYNFGVGFSTEYYHDMRESIDDITWLSKYMGNPKVREGLLFPSEELRYYNGVLPEGECRVISVCDVAWGGGDSLSMPFAYIYGNDVYIHDVIFNTGNKDITRPIVVGRIKYHKPYKARFEANNGGGEYADAVDRLLRSENFHTNITAVRAPSTQSKVARIIQYAPDIKKFYFIRPGKDENGKPYRSVEYQAFMDEVCTFTQLGKNLHDDGADSLAQLADELLHGTVHVEFGKRTW